MVAAVAVAETGPLISIMHSVQNWAGTQSCNFLFFWNTAIYFFVSFIILNYWMPLKIVKSTTNSRILNFPNLLHKREPTVGLYKKDFICIIWLVWCPTLIPNSKSIGFCLCHFSQIQHSRSNNLIWKIFYFSNYC